MIRFFSTPINLSTCFVFYGSSTSTLTCISIRQVIQNCGIRIQQIINCLWQKLLFPSSLHFLPASIPSHFLSWFSFSFPCFHSFCFSSTSIQNNNASELSRLVNLHSILNFKRLHLQANVLLSFKKMSTQ